MKRFAIALVALASALAAISARALEVAGRCSVTFFATSTVHDFKGSAPCAVLAIEPPDAEGRYRNGLDGDPGPEIGLPSERHADQVGGAERLRAVDLRLVVDVVGGHEEREALLRGAAPGEGGRAG